MKSGEVLGGRYEIQDLAGVGGMGEVHRAIDRERAAPVAVKLVYRRTAGDLARFEREARVLASLDHPSIVKYVGEARDEAGGYLVMEWLEGESLAARLARSRLTLAESVALCERIAQGLAHAHALGVVHRDLKPSNVLLVDGALEGAKIIDFGLARVDDDGGVPITATHATLGTPGYMAPEQARRPRDVDARADVYSLGCVLFRCLAGRAPFEGQNALEVLVASGSRDAPRLGSLVDGVPEGLDDLVARMLARDPSARPSDVAGELAIADAAIRSQRLGFRVPTVRPDNPSLPPSRGTLAAESPAQGAARVWRPTPTPPHEHVDPRGSTAEDTTPRPSAEAAGTNAAPAPSGSSGAAPSASASGAPRERMHPATAALLTILAVLAILGACGSGCLYCTCIAPQGRPASAPAKDAGRHEPAKAAPAHRPSTH